MIDSLPQPRTTDLASVPAFRWGVIGTGWIADRFVIAVTRDTSQRVVTVGSRSPRRAHKFAEGHGIETACGSYEELMAQDVDVIYIAMDHLSHASRARLALETGRNVLVERPMTPTVGAMRKLVKLVRGRDPFCIEAVWLLALPHFDVIRQVLVASLLGRIETVTVDMDEYLVDHRRAMGPAQGGEAMNDLEIYPLTFADWVLPGVEVVAAAGPRRATGAIRQFMVLLGGGERCQASVFASMLTNTPNVAIIGGSEATLVLDGPFYHPGPVKVRFRNGRVLSWDELRIHHESLFHGTVEVARCITTRHTESLLRPPEATITTIELVEQTRALMNNPA